MSKTNILMIDDDKELASSLKDYLEKFDIEMNYLEDSSLSLETINKLKPQLILLDIMMPKVDGLEVCRNIRKESSIPIIMLSARGDVTDRIIGIEVGADDYLPKPFEPRELVVRIQAILRRSKDAVEEKLLIFGELVFDANKRIVQLAGNDVDLTSMEFELLSFFVHNPGKKVTRDEIMNHLKGIDDNVYSRSVDILISRLRQKLGESSKENRFIETVYGTGYLFNGNQN